MSHVYVALFATLGELEAEQDDPSVRTTGLVDFAAPQVASVSLAFSAAWVEELRRDLTNEVLLEQDTSLTELRWTSSREEITRLDSRVQEVIVHTCHLGGDMVGAIVIQKRLVD